MLLLFIVYPLKCTPHVAGIFVVFIALKMITKTSKADRLAVVWSERKTFRYKTRNGPERLI